MNIDNFISRIARRTFCSIVRVSRTTHSSSGGGNGGQSGGALRTGAVFYTFPVPVPTPGQPVQGPLFNVPDGYYVEISPIPLNTLNCFFSTVSRQAAITGPRELVAPSAAVPRQIDTRNLGDIWVNSAVANEGVQITVRRNV
jgi:hypothetical protein